MDSILSRTTDIDCVFAQNDRMALGARHAVEARGISRHIDYVGVDAQPVKGGGLECINRGLLTASYIYPTRGDLVMTLAMNILEGRPFKRENSMYGALVTKDNAHILLLQNEELSKQREQLYTLHDKVDLYLAEYSHQRVYATLAIVIIALLLVSFALIYRSITIRRRMTEQTAEAKLMFFTNVSHEFRTPLILMADFNRIVMSRISDSSLSNEDVSGELDLSRVQMYRKVKALTGSTPVELIRIMRLKRAKRLLKQGGRTVSEVSYDVGFSSPSYFTKCFKEQLSRLPSG